MRGAAYDDGMRTQPLRDGAVTLADGRTLAYAEYGDLDGAPLVYFHGWPGSRLEATVLHDEAAARRVRVIAVDRPGYGRSTYKPRRRILDWPDDVRQLAAHLGLRRFAVWGTSGGGPYALACALKLGAQVEVTGDCSGAPPFARDPSRWRRIMTRVAHRFGFLVRGYYAVVAWRLRRNPRRTLALTARSFMFSKRDREIWKNLEFRQGFGENLLEAFRQGTRALHHDYLLYSSDWGFDVRDVTAKVRLWHGEADRIVQVRGARLVAAALPDCDATFYPGEGHFIIVERAGEMLDDLAASRTAQTREHAGG